MYYNVAQTKAVLLSKEEALALLDMCLNSNIETESVHEQAITKLSELVRGYMADEIEAQIGAAVDAAAGETGIETWPEAECEEMAAAPALETMHVVFEGTGILVSSRFCHSSAARFPRQEAGSAHMAVAPTF